MPPGLVDFLRGTVALFNYSKKYNYKLLINHSIHPVFKYFKNCEHYITNTYNIPETFELLSQASPEFIDHIIERLFQSGNDIFIITNCLLENKHILTNDCKIFLKTILTPSELLLERLYNVYVHLGLIGIGQKYINDTNYYCIHIRFGDKFINKEIIDENDKNIINILDTTIKNILEENRHNPIILISDSSIMANEVKKLNKNILYWDNKKIHLGNLIQKNEENQDHEEYIIDTLVDLITLSKSKKIFTFNISKQYKTTFSPFIARIYDIENIIFQML
jgi:hypothetical protein